MRLNVGKIFGKGAKLPAKTEWAAFAKVHQWRVTGAAQKTPFFGRANVRTHAEMMQL
jgi:hypothetical protein